MIRAADNGQGWPNPMEETLNTSPRRRSPWRFTRRLTDALGAQLVLGRHYQFRGAK